MQSKPNPGRDHCKQKGCRPFPATVVLAIAALLSAAVLVPGASAFRHKKDKDAVRLDKKFKGKLPITELTQDEAILHALNRLGYGPRPGDVGRIRQMGLEKWIDQQLDPDSLDDSAFNARLEKYPTLKKSTGDLLEEYPQPNLAAKQQGLSKEDAQDELKEKRREAVAAVQPTGNVNIDNAQRQLAALVGPNRPVIELSMAKLDRAVYSQRQLEAVMEDFWFNHFNVFSNKGMDRYYLTAYVRDTIRPHTMGEFSDLLIATAKSPAMLFFLDNWQSADPEAFAHWREQMEARRRFQGMFRGGLMPGRAGFPRVVSPFPPGGANGAPKQQQERGLNENYGREVMELHTVGVDAGYTQQDVIEMAKTLTGWTIREPRRDPEYMFRPEFHATGKKVVMGHTFDAGGEKDGEDALKMLANDPHTARRISTELAQRFVSDEPPQSLVDRMTKEYESTGGDIGSVLRAMIYSPEFWSRDAYRSKVKTPFELVASTARILDADISISLPLTQWIGRMGEPVFQCEPPTGYSEKSSIWVNTGALLNRLNFALTLASDHMGGANVDLQPLFSDDASKSAPVALSRVIDVFLNGQIADTTRSTLQERLDDPQILQTKMNDKANDSEKQVNAGLISGLVLGAPEFQRR
ncbi:MAG TPA: DUF1800 domain-containing protein [Candidatus Acidoferrales bacterium]|jgi:uncharacterized protein (DUF1800 family)|nr:DUF1800 domain-containing protein [Candidatus Acidoferrales bacterium]